MTHCDGRTTTFTWDYFSYKILDAVNIVSNHCFTDSAVAQQ